MKKLCLLSGRESNLNFRVCNAFLQKMILLWKNTAITFLARNRVLPKLVGAMERTHPDSSTSTFRLFLVPKCKNKRPITPAANDANRTPIFDSSANI